MVRLSVTPTLDGHQQVHVRCLTPPDQRRAETARQAWRDVLRARAALVVPGAREIRHWVTSGVLYGFLVGAAAGALAAGLIHAVRP